MTTTASYITETAAFEPFYYLKISGLPYYFGGTIDPTSSQYGADAWTLPTGYTWVGGLDTPDDTLEQSLPDLLGGIASAERLRLELLDFDVTTASGTYSFFGRMLALGRLTTNLTAASTMALLIDDLPASLSSGDTFNVQGTAALSTGIVYVGSEAININAVTPQGGGVYELGIATNGRNQYPCNDNYPPPAYYRTSIDADGNVNVNQATIVTQEPLSMIGRTVALYVGHMKTSGDPAPPDTEASALCRFIGRIKGVDYGREPGKFQIQLESIMADITTAKVAPGLAHAEIQPGFYFDGANSQWRTFSYGQRWTAADGTATLFRVATITIDNGGDNIYFYPETLVAAINEQLALNPLTLTGVGTARLRCYLFYDNGVPTAGFQMDSPTAGDLWDFVVSFSPFDEPPGTPDGEKDGRLLYALGFDKGSTWSLANPADDGNHGQIRSVLAPKPMPRVFVPLDNIDTTVAVSLVSTQDANGNRFFTKQFANSTQDAMVRFGDGNLALVSIATPTALTIAETAGFGPGAATGARFYFVPVGSVATVDQIVYFLGSNGQERIRMGKHFARLLCSTGGVTYDGIFNTFVEGVGLGLVNIVDSPSWVVLDYLFPARDFYVDATTTLDKLMVPVFKEVGVFLVWDVATSTIILRNIQTPSSFAATTFAFNESNRPKVGDRSTASIDYSNIRTGYTLKYGWDAIQQKFTQPEVTVTDNFAIGVYGISARVEQISDMTIQPYNGFEAGWVMEGLLKRSRFVKQPWLKVTRTVNKTGLTLSPGTYHQIIDNTLFNPFTGLRGITSDDGVYGWLMSVKHKYDDGAVTVTFLIDQANDQPRRWSPSALLNIASTQNGYVSTTGVVTLSAWYTEGAPGGSNYDGVDFLVGDKIILRAREVPSISDKTGTISAVATDGLTVTIDAGLGAVTTQCQTIMILRDYANATTARKTGSTTKVAFEGDGDTLLIESVARLHKWG